MEYSTSRSTSPATLNRRSLVDVLQIGHRAAEQLRRRFNRSPNTPVFDDSASAVSDFDLAEAILNSFNNSIAIAKNSDLSLINSRFPGDDCKIEGFGCGDGGGESSRTKDRRGCYKRRKRGESWTIDGEAAADDSFAWRKYGQKMILNNKFPRNYYRCTHKTDQGCLAIKQVQRISENPCLFRTTYNGQHSCKNPLKAPQITIPSSSPDQSDTSILVSFERSPNNHNNPFFPPPSIKREQRPTTAAAATTTNNAAVENQTLLMNAMMAMSQSPQSDYNHYLSSPDPTTFSGGAHMTGSDLGGDVISAGTYPGSASPHSFEIDNYINHLDFQFDCDLA